MHWKNTSKSTSKNEIQAEEPAASSPLAIWRPGPLPCRDDAETQNAGISAAIWSLEKLSPLKGGGITSYPQGSDPPWEFLKKHVAENLHRINFSRLTLPGSCFTCRFCFYTTNSTAVPLEGRQGLCLAYHWFSLSVTELVNKHQSGNKHICAAPLYLLILFSFACLRNGDKTAVKVWDQSP